MVQPSAGLDLAAEMDDLQHFVPIPGPFRPRFGPSEGNAEPRRSSAEQDLNCPAPTNVERAQVRPCGARNPRIARRAGIPDTWREALPSAGAGGPYMRLMLVAAALLAASPAARANDPAPPIPPAPSRFQNAPPEVRPYLEQARKADFLPDPLARCLAWPDIPGQQWPPGLVQAHCEYNFGPRLTLAKLDQHLREGSIAALEERLRRDLARHYSDDGFSEIIHAHFFEFDGSEETGRLTQSWVEAAPESPFAQVARGHWNRAMAGKARGTRYIQKTPQENLDRMRAYGDAAMANYLRALEIEPTLTEAHAGVIDVATLGGRPEAMVDAVKKARELAPACRAWGHQLMGALEPRWGGSLEQMAEFAATLTPYLEKRPLASIVAVMPQFILANELYRAEAWAEAEQVARDATLKTTYIPAYRVAGLSILAQKTGNRWEALMYLLGESRLSDGSAHAARQRARLMRDVVQDLEWSALIAQRTVDMEPGNAYGQWLLASARRGQGRVDEAEAAYLEAMRDPSLRRSSLINLAALLLMKEQLPRAVRYVETLTSEYPEEGWGWFYNLLLVVDRKGGSYRIEDEEVTAAFEKFEQTANPDDPHQQIQLRAWRESRRHGQALKAKMEIDQNAQGQADGE